MCRSLPSRSLGREPVAHAPGKPRRAPSGLSSARGGASESLVAGPSTLRALSAAVWPICLVSVLLRVGAEDLLRDRATSPCRDEQPRHAGARYPSEPRDSRHDGLADERDSTYRYTHGRNVYPSWCRCRVPSPSGGGGAAAARVGALWCRELCAPPGAVWRHEGMASMTLSLRSAVYRTKHTQRARFASPDSPFFMDVRPKEGLAFKATPVGWRSDQMSPWTRVYAVDAWKDLPQHGWKIHVSAVPGEAAKTLADVAGICEEFATPFKHLSHYSELLHSLKKYADRRSGGKFITIYPRTDQHLVELLEALEARLRGRNGPYILTDVRYGSAPVFFRYGAFFPVELPDGRYGILTPSGEVVEDARDLKFSIPDFVQVPEAIKNVVDGRLKGLESGAGSTLAPYVVSGCLHYSFAGGVYRAIDGRDKGEVILKEAREFSGYTSETESAQDRLRSEAAALKALEHLSFTPRFCDYITLPGHEFLVEDFIDGPTLQDWIAVNYPFFFTQSFEDYERQAMIIAKQIVQIVDATHSAGLAIMDLQPKNLIIAAGLKVHLIDLEGVRGIAQESRDVIGTPGFIPLNARTNRERDLFSLYQVLLYLFSPSTDSVLSPGLERARHRAAADSYSSAVTSLLDEAHRRVPPRLLRPRHGLRDSRRAEPDAADMRFEWSEYRDRIVAGILTAQEMEGRSDAGFPGDARQFWDGPSARWDLETGGAGVLLALARLGLDTRQGANRLASELNLEATPTHGLLRGLPGIAMCLAEAGAPERAVEIIGSRQPSDQANLNLRSGLGGTLLAYLSLMEAGVQTPALDELIADFAQALGRPDSRVDSSGAETGNAIGIFDGWSGVGVACEALFRHTGEEYWHDHAVKFLERDLAFLRPGPRHELFVNMSGVNYSYLSEGSAGIGVACAVVSHCSYADTIESVSKSLASRLSLNAGLFRGTAGWAASLLAIGGSGQMFAETQLRDLLCGRSVSFDGDDSIHFPGDNCFCLSTDYSTGAAGIALAVESLRLGRSIWTPWSVSLFDLGMEGGVENE